MNILLTFFLHWTGATLPVESPIHPTDGATVPVESPVKPGKRGAR